MAARTVAALAIASACFLALGRLDAAQVLRLAPPGEYYLAGNLEGARGTITTDRDRQPATFAGAISFRVSRGQKGELSMSLVRFNLVSKGVLTARSGSGVIGLHLTPGEH